MMMEKLKIIATKALTFRENMLELVEKVKIQMTWREANPKFPDHLPQKTT